MRNGYDLASMATLSTLYGYRLVADPNLPAVKAKQCLSQKVLVSQEFREQYDAWLLDFFGEEMQVFIIGETVIANPRVIRELKRYAEDGRYCRAIPGPFGA